MSEQFEPALEQIPACVICRGIRNRWSHASMSQRGPYPLGRYGPECVHCYRPEVIAEDSGGFRARVRMGSAVIQNRHCMGTHAEALRVASAAARSMTMKFQWAAVTMLAELLEAGLSPELIENIQVVALGYSRNPTTSTHLRAN